MRTILKLGLFLLSNLGYWEYFRSRHKINLYCAPVFTIAVQFTALFAAGILNCLEEMTFILYAVGLLLLLKSLYETKLRSVLQYLNPGYLYLAAAFLMAGSLVYGRGFAHIDNFTHWATVVRSMLFTDRFPCFKDIAVTFTTYPLGTAAYIYYFCRLINDAESFQMLAQGYMIICAVLPIFSFARNHKLLNMLLITAMTLFLFQYNISLTDLRVDTVMPLVGMAAMVFVYEHCGSRERETPLRVYYTFPVLLWLMNIKHPAILYVVIALILLLVGTNRADKRWKECLLLGAGLLLARQVWSMHCDYVYYDDNAGMHTMSADWFRYVLGDKTPEDIWRITRKFLSFVTTGCNYFWLLTWLVLLALLIVWLGGAERKKYAVLLGGTAALYVIYTVSVLGMYIFSMPVWEGLSGAERYMKSIDVAVYYLFALCAVQLISKLERQKLSAVVAVAVTALTLLGWKQQIVPGSQGDLYCSQEARQSFEEPIAEHGLGLGHSYLLCISAETKAAWSDLPRYIWRYNLLTDAVDQIVVTEETQLDIEKEYDYVVIFDQDNPVIRQWLEKNYPERVGETIIQHFV